MRFKIISLMMGRLLCMISVFLLLPIIVAIIYREYDSIDCFAFPATFSLFGGILLECLYHKNQDEPLASRDAFFLVTGTWLLLSVMGAFPFYLSGFFGSFVNSFFESASGFTTTGASILTDIEILPKALLFWRSFTHWVGGIGIIVLAVAILPQLSVGGMQLLKSEMPGPTFEQLKPRIKQTVLSLWRVYMLFCVVETLCLWWAGMSFFESLCHMFGTMGTGGFSTRNASMGAFSLKLQMIVSFFMFCAGMNFVLHYAWLRGKFNKLFKDGEWRFYVVIILLSTFVISLDLIFQGKYPWHDAISLSIFQVLTIVTTTGYATASFEYWPYLSCGILFLLMFVGGCAGSTSGGFKQIRLLLLFQRTKQSIMEHIFPQAIVPIKHNKLVVPDSVMHGISSLFLVNIVLFSFAVLPILAYNYDFVTATTAVVASLMNIGPGLAKVGASQNYSFFPDSIKLLLSFLMIVGRLEVFTVLVLFFPITWKR